MSLVAKKKTIKPEQRQPQRERNDLAFSPSACADPVWLSSLPAVAETAEALGLAGHASPVSELDQLLFWGYGLHAWRHKQWLWLINWLCGP